MKNICIFHKDSMGHCLDGFAAAMVVRKALGEADTVFIPLKYGQSIPEVCWRDIAGAIVYLVDFSFKIGPLRELARCAKRVIVIDHHKTALALAGEVLPENVELVLDTTHSGCVLTWNYFFNDVDIPDLLLFIQDRDLWLFKRPNTRAITMALFSYPFTFSACDALQWDQLEHEESFSYLVQEGLTLTRNMEGQIYDILSNPPQWMYIRGVKVPVMNVLPMFKSEVGSQLSANHPFAAVYVDYEHQRVFSLRSVPGCSDVEEIATFYGGGGHRSAASFALSHRQAEWLRSPIKSKLFDWHIIVMKCFSTFVTFFKEAK